MCGNGKTSYAIELINENPNQSYVYVTPLLSEIDRIKKATKKPFYDPIFKDGRKINGLNDLLCSGFNIAVTHSTFSNSTDETVEFIRQGNYTLILDEVIDVVTEFNDINNNSKKVKPKDIKLLLNEGIITTDKYGYVEWIGDSYVGGSFTEIERLAKRKNLLLINNTLFLWEFPIDVFLAFDKVIILTYLFNGSILKYFFDYHDVSYILSSVEKSEEKYNLVEYKSDIQERKKYKDLIKICTDEKLNNYPYSAFTSSWYKSNIGNNKKLIKSIHLKNNLYNYFRHKQKAKVSQVMWTTYENSKKAVEASGYIKIRNLKTDEKNQLSPFEQKKLENKLSCFVPCNARATNDFRERNVLAYLCNMWINPYIKSFFQYKSIVINEDAFALSCLIQWVWRSCIRDGKKIYLYLPSQRMRKLFINWLEENTC